MESCTEVLRVTAAIVSAFQTAADTLEVIKDRKEKAKRRKEKEVEELWEIGILHKSLVEVLFFSKIPTKLSSESQLTIAGWSEMSQALRE